MAAAGTTSRVVESGDTVTRSVVAFFEYVSTDPLNVKARMDTECRNVCACIIVCRWALSSSRHTGCVHIRMLNAIF
jgi:hypothetical protein